MVKIEDIMIRDARCGGSQGRQGASGEAKLWRMERHADDDAATDSVTPLAR